MALLGVVACMSGLVNCTPDGPSPTIEIDQCEEAAKQLKTEYGDDYLTNRAALPLTGYGLQYIKSIGCETTFGYDILADEFCQSLENYDTQIGGGQTCGTTRDPTNSMRSRWCLNEEGPGTETSNGVLIGADAANRLKGNSKCSKEMLSNKYDETWVKYCKAKPGDSHCTCYNMKNMVCGAHPEAAGCTYYKVLEENKQAFTNTEERAALEKAANTAGTDVQDPESYNILKSKGHCRPRSCDSGYIPPDVKSDCESTYQICGQDIDIRTNTNTNIAVKCNYDPDRVISLPDWWNEERDTSFIDAARAKATARDAATDAATAKKNKEYLTYGGVGSVSLCSLCMVVLMIMYGGSKRI
jgi:hypothetical protein